MTEEWTEESETGGRKGQKLARYDLIPPDVLEAVARQYGRGASKYDDRNWERGYNWSLSYAAAQRHLNAYWGGENWDPDPYWDLVNQSRPHHLDAAIFHLMTLREFFNTHPEFDDRPKVAKARARGQAQRLERDGSLAQRETPTKPAVQAAQPKQTEDGRDSAVQASRWQLP